MITTRCIDHSLHVLRNRHLQQHHAALVLDPEVLISSLDITLLPDSDLLCHLLSMDLGCVHQLLLQHIVPELQLLVQIYCLKKIILIFAKDLFELVVRATAKFRYKDACEPLLAF